MYALGFLIMFSYLFLANWFTTHPRPMASSVSYTWVLGFAVRLLECRYGNDFRNMCKTLDGKRVIGTPQVLPSSSSGASVSPRI